MGDLLDGDGQRLEVELFLMDSCGNSPLSSIFAASGSSSLVANSRAMLRIIVWSSVRLKSNQAS